MRTAHQDAGAPSLPKISAASAENLPAARRMSGRMTNRISSAPMIAHATMAAAIRRLFRCQTNHLPARRANSVIA